MTLSKNIKGNPPEDYAYVSGLIQGWANRLVKEGSDAIPIMLPDMQTISRELREIAFKEEKKE